MVWDGLVAFDLFFAGMGAWAFIFAALTIRRCDETHRVRLAAYTVALVAVAFGAVILAIDAKGGLNNPLRYLGLLSNFGSAMAWGVVLITLFMLGDLICVVLLACKRAVPRALEIVVAVVGVGVSLYTGVLLGSAGAFPLWNLGVLPCVFLVSAAYTGYAACRLTVRLAGGKDAVEQPAWLDKVAVALPVVEAVALVVLLVVVAQTGGSAALAAAASVANLVSGSCAVAFWGGAVAVGLVVPCALAIARLRGFAPTWADLAECACVLVGGLVFRYAIVVAAVAVFA